MIPPRNSEWPCRYQSYWQQGCNAAKEGKEVDRTLYNSLEGFEREGYINGYRFGLTLKGKENGNTESKG